MSSVHRPLVADRKSAALTEFRKLSVWTLGLWAICLFIAIRAVVFFHAHDALGPDAHAYWLTGHHHELYNIPPKHRDSYLYSPFFAQFIWPLTKLPWPVFLGIWFALEFTAFVWLLWPLPVAWRVPAILLATLEVNQGNILGMLGVATVIGLRRPAYWAFPLLTKITTGLGPVWFAGRREWRALAISVGATALLAATSYLLNPSAWSDWVHFLNDNRGNDASLPYRVAAGVVIAVVAARINRSWLLAPAILLASPVLHGWMYVALLAPIPRLLQLDRENRTR
jgi:hypothetical protein